MPSLSKDHPDYCDPFRCDNKCLRAGYCLMGHNEIKEASLPSLEQLKELGRALSEAVKGNLDLDVMLFTTFYGRPPDLDDHVPRYTSSLDAADALRREVMPDLDYWSIEYTRHRAVASLWRTTGRVATGAVGDHAAPAIAIVRAIVAAKTKEVENALGQ